MKKVVVLISMLYVANFFDEMRAGFDRQPSDKRIAR